MQQKLPRRSWYLDEGCWVSIKHINLIGWFCPPVYIVIYKSQSVTVNAKHKTLKL